MNIIKGLDRITIGDSMIYFNDDMLGHNICIFEETYILEDKVETYISIKHYNEIDAFEKQLYWGGLLAPIQVYRIIKDVYDLFESSTISEFLDIVDILSIGGTSASIQTKPESKENIKKEIRDDFDTLRAEIVFRG